jgi:hypothetical protein
MPTRFIWNIIFFNEAFEYGNSGIFRYLRWMQNLHHSAWGREILYADISSEDEQLLIRLRLCGGKKKEHGRRLKVKIHILF